MIEVIFTYEIHNIKMQCNIENKLKEIAKRLKLKIKKENNDNLFFLYEGNKINEELTLKQIINNKNVKQIQILVFNGNVEKNEKMIVSKEIICPICKEKILLNIRDYQIDDVKISIQ